MQVARSICSQLTQAVVRIGADEHVHTFHVLPTGATTKMQLWGEGVQQGKGVQAIPFAEPPASLPADMVGYVGFDPLGVSTLMDINFLREAELKHCRVAMLAAAGAIAQDLYHFPVILVYRMLTALAKFGTNQTASPCDSVEAMQNGLRISSLGAMGCLFGCSWSCLGTVPGKSCCLHVSAVCRR